jgi:uroporphyrinogen decarboxylase
MTSPAISHSADPDYAPPTGADRLPNPACPQGEPLGLMMSRERLLCALNRGIPDRLPVTTHHLMPYFLNSYLPGMSDAAFFDHLGLDAIRWIRSIKPDRATGQCLRSIETGLALHSEVIITAEWQIEQLPAQELRTRHFRIVTPRGTLTATLQFNEHTSWSTEHLIKEKADVDLIAEFMPPVACDVEAVNRAATALGQRGIVRSEIPSFPIFGQPGCWQDAACLVGMERLIVETFDDPGWVHTLLRILQRRKMDYIRSLAGARCDLLELGGGGASTTVISPKIFARFVAPYDSELIACAHEVGYKIVYHTCGGMMPILEQIADMAPDAMETFTPPAMGGDVDLGEAKRRIGDRVCMIGGFDQFHDLWGCSPDQTRRAVRRCFEQAGPGGGYILAPSDHFFDADPALLSAFADEAHRCFY